MITASLMTEKFSEAQLSGLTSGTLSTEQKASSRSSYNMMDISVFVLIVVIIIGILIYFTG